MLAEKIESAQVIQFPFREISEKSMVHAERYSIRVLRYSIGAIYFWFGALKLVHQSAADSMAKELLSALGLSSVYPELFFLLGVLEVMIGIFFLDRTKVRIAAALFSLHIPLTALPLCLLPHLTFIHPVVVPTLEGQYILKNLVLVAGVLAILEETRHIRVARAARVMHPAVDET